MDLSLATPDCEICLGGVRGSFFSFHPLHISIEFLLQTQLLKSKEKLLEVEDISN